VFRRLGRALLAGAILISFALSAGADATLAAPDLGVPPPLTGDHTHTSQHVCTAEATGSAACHAHVRTDRDAAIARPAPGVRPPKARPDVLGNNGAYDPAYLQSAYNVPTGAGAGQTVAIVDAYDAPNVESDLANYRSFFGLPSCTSANGCFSKVNQSGASSPLPVANSSWAQEISLDVDMVSAICPNCKILLVEANSSKFSDLGTAVNSAVRMGAQVVSNSYGGGEFSGETSYDTSYFEHAGVTITVSSGDSGYGVEYPAASPYVTAVGGTTLNQTGNTGSRNATETVWSGAGSGCSAYEPKQTWQQDAGCGRRTVADVSAEADPNTGVWVYDSTPSAGQSGWLVFGGTSVAAPIVGAVSALAGSGPSGNFPTSYPYGGTGALNDVTSGSNGGCGSYLCTGGPGYDGPTGLGTPNGTAAFTFAAASDFALAVNPSSVSGLPGATASYTVTLSTTNGYASPVNLSVTGLPAGATATFSPSSLTPTGSGSTSTLSVAIPTGATAGTSSLTITAAGTDASTTTHTASVALTVSAPTAPDFSLSASPSSASVPTSGGSVSYTVSLTPVGGYASAVSLAISGLPSGATGTFNPASVTPSNTGATSTLSVKVPFGASAGSYQLTITGTGSDPSTLTHSTNVTLSVNAPGSYSLSASPSSQTVKPGASTTYTATLTTSNGYNSSVGLAVSGLPSGASATFSPSSLTPTSGGASSTLQVQTTSSTPTGSYALTITATGSDAAATTQTATVTLQVVASDFSIAAASSSLTVLRTASGSDSLTLTASGGYSFPVTLSVSGLPSRVTASFSANPVTPTASSTLKIKANVQASPGTYHLTVTARGSDGTTHSTTITLTVQ
jgi:uncharacterized membrane protein